MKAIKERIYKIDDELDGAKEYAEEYLMCKAQGNIAYTNRYKEMAEDELKHAMYIHDETVQKIEELKTVYKPPVEMEEVWKKSHATYVEKQAWIKQMLAL